MESLNQTLQLKLINKKTRPSFEYESNGEYIIALFDTGAIVPVWCAGENVLRKAYPESVKQERKCELSGFGRGTIDAYIYVIPDFILTKDDIVFHIHNLYIAVCEMEKVGCDFVLSETMFSHTDMVYTRRSEKKLDIEFENREYYCTPRFFGKHMEVVTWVQKESK